MGFDEIKDLTSEAVLEEASRTNSSQVVATDGILISITSPDGGSKVGRTDSSQIPFLTIPDDLHRQRHS
jgi:hypothetical protein